MAGPLDALASGGAAILGRPLGGTELQSFEKYLKLLQKWQKSQRLVGSADAAWLVENVILDSLLFLKVLPPSIASLADVGSGAGLPGLPIKIVRPELRVTLIESRAKRASFLAAAVRELGLGDTEVVTARAEHYAAEHPRAVDAVVMRCAGDFGEIGERVSALVAPGGVVVASGPPSAKRLKLGEWVQVRGVSTTDVRRFAVYRVS